MRHAVLAAVLLLVTGITAAAEPAQRTLTFEDRVNAQAAIERVYYSHQIGATKPFDMAVPRGVLESKVRKYLDQTAALKVYWKTAVTDEMLQRELERMANGSRMPERLLELYAAFGNDPFLIKECLARATLVDRLARDFFAFDPTLHADARRRAEELHRQLSTGELSPTLSLPNRSEAEFVVSETGDEESNLRSPASLDLNGIQPLRRELSLDEFRKQLAQLPQRLGHVSALNEERDGFVLRVVLSETTREFRTANYVVPKTSWDDWWATSGLVTEGDQAAIVASQRAPLPKPKAIVPVRSVADRLGASRLTCGGDDSWTPTATTGAPSGRSEHTAVWTGSLMLAWGGSGSGGYLNTGGRYDPATDTWTPISTTAAPIGRIWHTAVWTGSLMVIWGGYNPLSGHLNSGGRYDPTTDTWSPTSMTGAPYGRYGVTAVWTGNLMVVWGGSADFDHTGLDTGGRYDPASDAWTPTSTTGAPSPRWVHTAVWTGSLMVVWGGYDGGNGVKSGGRYDPAIDSWTPTATAGAPSGRDSHTAVWTGTLMVVWGGYDEASSLFLNTGARYEVATDTWTPTSATGAPTERYFHTAFWTGTLMVVFGGNNNNNLNTGGRYIAATDHWAATSTAGAPSVRGGSTAVWTGSLMVVWGGSGTNGALNTGGRYSVLDAAFDHDGDGYSECQGDCSDYDAAIYPGAPQYCDGTNNDCSDPLWPAVPDNEADGDHDGYRICGGDCDDANPNIRPAALEICNGIDDNCNDLIDDGLARTLYRDADGDGYGNANVTQSTCYSPPGWVLQAGDCNDSNAAVHPGEPDLCNGIDDNCNGQLDEDAAGVDSDGDGIHNSCDNCRFAFNSDQLDSDGDHVGNACDNCLFVANASQVDADGDARGDACDNCPRSYNPSQDDLDADRVGDACDNCLFDFNPSQSDFNHDGEGDLCDLNDGLIYVYSTDKNYREWQAESGYSAWNSYRGSLAVLRATGEYTQAQGANPLAAHDCGVSDAYVFDALDPSPGEVAFNLVTGVAGGVESGLGANSAGVPRANANPCP